MHSFVQDLRYGVRTLARERTFAVVAILTLAMALGATSAIFTVLNAVLLQPLPYAEPDRLVKIRTATALGEGNQLSYINIADARVGRSVGRRSAHATVPRDAAPQ